MPLHPDQLVALLVQELCPLSLGATGTVWNLTLAATKLLRPCAGCS